MATPYAPKMVEPIFERIRSHDFHPLEAARRTFTVDRVRGRPGVADLDDGDGRMRLSAVRDLIAVALRDPWQVATGLVDGDLAVRYLSAAALGVARGSDAAEALERVLVEDLEPLARVYAAIAFGESGATGSLEFLRARREQEAHPDVRHQLELAAAQIEAGATASDAQCDAYLRSRKPAFGGARAGDVAPDFSLEDTQGRAWHSTAARGRWLVLVWVFADWCPVCHREFAELIALREAFEEQGVQVATLEAHDAWRARLMVGREIEPELWGSRAWFREVYTERIWWPHLVDLAGSVGAGYGTDPMAFAVHGEFVNRPTTVIVDPEGVVRFAYRGTFWGDRPSIGTTLEMIRTQAFEFVHVDRLSAHT